MLIIWRGFGWLVPVIIVASFLLSEAGLDAVYGEGFYIANEWSPIAAIVIGSLLIAFLGYFLNHKKRIIHVDPESGKKKKSPAHTLFFIPIEAWAIIIPALFFWIESNTAERHAEEMVLIESPAINDTYSVDFTEIFTNSDKKYKYGILKIVEIQPTGIEVVASEMAYDKKSGVREDVRNGKTKEISYYAGASFFLSFQDTVTLKKKGAIFQVSRN